MTVLLEVYVCLYIGISVCISVCHTRLGPKKISERVLVGVQADDVAGVHARVVVEVPAGFKQEFLHEF